MNFPIYQGGGVTSALPHIPSSRNTHDLNRWQVRAAAYQPDDRLCHAVSVALMLGKPLLVTGEPGVGKTDLAYSIAHQFGCDRPIVFSCKSTTRSRDVFYTYDTMGRYVNKQLGHVEVDRDEPLKYLTYQALGLAIVRAMEREQVAHLLPKSVTHEGPRRSVVLIDEVDKAPRDFPNDILDELDKMYFHISELAGARMPPEKHAVPAQLKPVVVLTSNAEKHLPEPFLRRCVFYHIPFPRPEKLEAIAAAHFGTRLVAGSPFLLQALDFFQSLREADLHWEKKPSTAEFLDWLEALITLGADTEVMALNEQTLLLERSLSCLAKTVEDAEKAEAFMHEWLDQRR